MHIIVPELANIYTDQEVRDQDNEQRAKSRLYAHLHRGAKPWRNTTKRSNTPKEREEGQAYSCVQSSTPHGCKQERKQYHHRVTTTSAVHAHHKSCEEAPDINNWPCINNEEELKRQTNPNLNTPTLKLRVHKESYQNPYGIRTIKIGWPKVCSKYNDF